jgi:hypothetical protein
MWFCDLVEQGEAIPSELASWLAQAFRAHLDDGTDLKAALDVKKPQGRKTAWATASHRLDTAQRVQNLRDGDSGAGKRMSRKAALGRMAAELGVDDDTVGRWYDEYRPVVKTLQSEAEPGQVASDAFSNVVGASGEILGRATGAMRRLIGIYDRK